MVNFDPDFSAKGKDYRTFSFVYTVDKPNETIAFAYDRPYTFTRDLQRYLRQLSSKSKIVRREVLCKTPTGLDCPLLIITEDCQSHMPNDDWTKLYLYKDHAQINSLFKEFQKQVNFETDINQVRLATQIKQEARIECN